MLQGSTPNDSFRIFDDETIEIGVDELVTMILVVKNASDDAREYRLMGKNGA